MSVTIYGDTLKMTIHIQLNPTRPPQIEFVSGNLFLKLGVLYGTYGFQYLYYTFKLG